MRIKGEEELLTIEMKARQKLSKAKKKDDNIIKFTDFYPPGKHFFYFVFKNEYVFLSPNYDVVRFKESNAFLNVIIISPRVERLELVTLGRNIYAQQDIRFNKDKSVWKTF